MRKQLTKTQAAARADVSERTIERSIKRGELKARKVYERVIIDESDLDSFLAQRANPPAASTGAHAA
jgi:excisionase family DNA binding protein